MLVVLAGPDGSGKSSVAELLLQEVGGDFLQTAHFHWRPRWTPDLRALLRPGSKQAAIDRPQQKRRPGTAESILRFAYYSFDFVVGSRLSDFSAFSDPHALVLVERYYLDLLVDRLRYAMDVPEKLVRLLQPLVPPPDLVLLLDGPPQLFFERKEELTRDEIARQLRRHRELLPTWGGRGLALDADAPLESVVSAAAAAVRETAGRLRR